MPQRDAAARRGMATRGDDPSSDDAPCTLPIGAAIAALAADARETWMTERAARECARAMRRHAGSLQMEFVARAIAVADKTSAIVETWLDDRSDAVERLASTQARFQRECAALRLQLEKALAAARSAKRNGAEDAKEAVLRCVKGCEALRVGLLRDMRALSAHLTAEEAQLSRKFVTEWRALEDAGNEALRASIDFDKLIAQDATRIDATALLALVEDCTGCAAVGTIADPRALVEAYENECVLMCARRLHNFVAKPPPRGGEELSAVVKAMKLESQPSASPSTGEGSTTPAAPSTPAKRREEAAKTRESVALEFAAHLRGYFGARDDARAVLDDLEDACADFIAVGIAQY